MVSSSSIGGEVLPVRIGTRVARILDLIVRRELDLAVDAIIEGEFRPHCLVRKLIEADGLRLEKDSPSTRLMDAFGEAVVRDLDASNVHARALELFGTFLEMCAFHDVHRYEQRKKMLLGKLLEFRHDAPPEFCEKMRQIEESFTKSAIPVESPFDKNGAPLVRPNTLQGWLDLGFVNSGGVGRQYTLFHPKTHYSTCFYLPKERKEPEKKRR